MEILEVCMNDFKKFSAFKNQTNNEANLLFLGGHESGWIFKEETYKIRFIEKWKPTKRGFNNIFKIMCMKSCIVLCIIELKSKTINRKIQQVIQKYLNSIKTKTFNATAN